MKYIFANLERSGGRRFFCWPGIFPTLAALFVHVEAYLEFAAELGNVISTLAVEMPQAVGLLESHNLTLVPCVTALPPGSSVPC
mmetsp:Transcript_148034/g.475329  ORF Transcript_148034/g.475329 Transcript_148034/m.475329 type:complete len:84 (+) Transcript_148034:275-526(+)